MPPVMLGPPIMKPPPQIKTPASTAPPKKYILKAAGQVWEDSSLAQWDESMNQKRCTLFPFFKGHPHHSSRNSIVTLLYRRLSHILWKLGQ